MDQATQQNAALVEESAAAAESLRDQAQQLVQVVAQFKLDDEAASGVVPRVPAPAPRSAAVRRPAPAAKPAVTPRVVARAKAPETAAMAVADEEWAAF